MAFFRACADDWRLRLRIGARYGGFFPFLERDRRLANRFASAMAQGSAAVREALPGVFGDERPVTIADVGGGDGSLLAAVLHGNPQARGILIDLPGTAEEVPIEVEELIDSGRLSLRHGSFFDPLPTADAYLLCRVLHNWSDGECVRILRRIREASASARVLVVERPADGDPLAAVFDLHMLVMTSGRERTLAEYDRLAARCELTRGGRYELALGFWALDYRGG